MDKRCNVCGLTGKYEFGEQEHGTCKFCRSFNKKTFAGEEQLLKDLNVQEGEKIGIALSGGKDSCYMTGKLVDLLGPDKVTAFFFYKPGLTSEVAHENVNKVVEKLGIELVTSVDSQAYERFKKNLTIFLRHPDPAATRVLLCVGCRYGITENLYNRGARMGITKYVSGASYLELAPFKEELLMKRSPFGNIDEGFENVIRCYEKELDYGNNLDLIRRDQKYKYKNNDTLSNNFGTHYKYQLFDFDNYFENIPEKVEAAVTERFDWKKTDRSWHFDCIIEDFKDVLYYGMLGYTELDFKLAAMVRYGLLTKDESLKQVKAQTDKLENSYETMEKKLRDMNLQFAIPDLQRFYRNSRYLKSPRRGKSA